MTAWPADTIERIAATDDLHIAPYRADERTPGTLTWIWSVVVDGRLFVRAYNGVRGRWYRSAMAQRAGRITAAGGTYDVAFAPIDDPELNERIDTAYAAKYAGSPYLPPMIAAGPEAATVEITRADYRLRWHRGQKWLERFMNATRRIGVPQRGQGSPSRP